MTALVTSPLPSVALSDSDTDRERGGWALKNHGKQRLGEREVKDAWGYRVDGYQGNIDMTWKFCCQRMHMFEF